MTQHVVNPALGDTVLVNVPPAPTEPPPIEPPPVEPPPTGNVHEARTSAKVLELLARKDLGTAPIILVPSGTVLTRMTFGTQHGGTSNSNRTRIKADGAFLDCGGGNQGIAYNGGKYIDLEGLRFRNGNFTQNGIITIGYAGKPAATKGVAFRRVSHDQTCVGPARASRGTADATAHFFYLAPAKDGESHDDILIEDCSGDANDRGLAAAIHLYSGATKLRNVIVRRFTARGYTQAVMAWAGGAENVLIEDFNGIDCYTVFRLKYGTGRLVRPKSSHPGGANKTNPLYEKGSGWSIDSVAGLG